MTANDISKALHSKYSDHRRYAIGEEIGLTTGGGCRRLDMIVMDCFYSNGFRIDGFEFKISVSDLRRELEDPDKHLKFFDVLDFYSLAAPAEVINPMYDVIPKNWGVLIINEDGTAKYKRKPLPLHDETITGNRKIDRGFIASFVRSIQGYAPSAEKLRAEYDRGFKEGVARERLMFNHREREINRKAEKLERYELLESRCRLWNKEDINKAFDEFEAFRKLEIDDVNFRIDMVMKELTALKEKLSGGEEE